MTDTPVVECGCGWSPPLTEWDDAELVGFERWSPSAVLELRNCPRCNSTRAFITGAERMLRAANIALRARKRALEHTVGGLDPAREGRVTAIGPLAVAPPGLESPNRVKIDGVWYVTFTRFSGAHHRSGVPLGTPTARCPWRVRWRPSTGALPIRAPDHAHAWPWFRLAVIEQWIDREDTPRAERKKKEKKTT